MNGTETVPLLLLLRMGSIDPTALFRQISLKSFDYLLVLYAEYEIWPNNVTDKTMRRIIEQNLFVQAYARQRNDSGLLFMLIVTNRQRAKLIDFRTLWITKSMFVTAYVYMKIFRRRCNIEFRKVYSVIVFVS